MSALLLTTATTKLLSLGNSLLLAHLVACVREVAIFYMFGADMFLVSS
ncbi:hypothetical protein CPAR01_15131 [Colletotrichum paranaense]|nr:uncharacterized protein CPAR01_15131 [Colletotrichum paranaense]XP_060377382.1 uncharacterized protein CTAM01_11964 [Colletotrichum tamarilloi]XP_060406011.1 uncharacterized protein CABS01_00114 [Colletotrichum abscissum]KAK1487031.1 hypothetical protein CTAM01_11964 [Colletotrichum tamarilloi]KAK1520080.1 hypothetical protein CPAR01_15131 [Colletotrichum paranaense]KAK1525025.1 hypothetical protein CABS01_00114 [Colletotrichum abscissum]